jgi:hypothetical protein
METIAELTLGIPSVFSDDIDNAIDSIGPNRGTGLQAINNRKEFRSFIVGSSSRH